MYTYNPFSNSTQPSLSVLLICILKNRVYSTDIAFSRNVLGFSLKRDAQSMLLDLETTNEQANLLMLINQNIYFTDNRHIKQDAQAVL